MLTAAALTVLSGLCLVLWMRARTWSRHYYEVAGILDRVAGEWAENEQALADRIVGLEWERHLSRQALFAAPDEEGTVTVDVRA